MCPWRYRSFWAALWIWVCCYCNHGNAFSYRKTASICGRQPNLATSDLGTSLILTQQQGSRSARSAVATRQWSKSPLGGRNEDDEISNLPFMTLALPIVGILALWPLLAVVWDANDPTNGFDIDMFMALKGILDPASTSGVEDLDGILELPPLSPAEQLVGAIFGPP